MVDWLQRIRDEIAHTYYLVCSKPAFWVWVFLASCVWVLIAGLALHSEIGVGMGVAVALVSLVWCLMAAADEDRIEDPWAQG